MSKMQPKEVVCGVCGGISVQYVVISTSSFGAPDLDFRPPPVEQNTILSWVQQCPHCGHAAMDLTVGFDSAQEKIITIENNIPKKETGNNAANLHRGGFSVVGGGYIYYCEDEKAGCEHHWDYSGGNIYRIKTDGSKKRYFVRVRRAC